MRSKRILCGVTAAAIMLSSINITAGAEELKSAVVEKTYSAVGEQFTQDKITYEEQPDGSLSVIKADYALSELFIPGVVNGKLVKSIGDNAFVNHGNLKRVTIPDSVTSIGYAAFANCSGLPSVTIPKSVQTIDDHAFFQCYNLTSITIPEGVTSIGSETFYGCSALASVTIPKSVKTIGDSAFFQCSALSSITLPEGVTSIGDYAFEKCSSLTSVVMPSSIKSTRHTSFYNCNKLQNIFFSNTKEQWEELLQSSWNGVVYTDYDSFTPTVFLNAYDPSARSETYAPSNVSLNGITYDIFSDGTAGVKLADANITDVNIPETVLESKVKYIESSAFYGCEKLTSVTLLEGIVSIANDAFYECKELSSITIPSSITSIGNSIFEECRHLRIINYSGYVETWKQLLTDSGWDGQINYTSRNQWGDIVHENIVPKVNFTRYDINGDGYVSIDDVVALLRIIVSSEEDIVYDMNNDGIVNINDVTRVLRFLVFG